MHIPIIRQFGIVADLFHTPPLMQSLTRFYRLRTFSSSAGPPPASWRPRARAATLSRLRSEEFDVVVVGGGCVGVGVAWEASTRGLKVALVERGDFSSGTSGRSTKLIHGGIRYLEAAFKNLDKGMFDLVTEALDERAHLLNAAPYMAKPLPTLLPINSWWEIPYVWIGTKVYDWIAGRDSGVPGAYYISRAAALAAFPRLNGETLKGAIVYHDGKQNDTRMNVMIAATAEEAGGVLANYCRVEGVVKGEGGRAAGVTCVDEQQAGAGGTGERFTVRAKAVINATGCFGDALRQLDTPSAKPMIQGAAGVHVILPSSLCPPELGLIVPKTRDGRVLFILPWEGHTLAGTTDAPCPISYAPQATAQDVGFILGECNRYLTGPPLTPKDVLSAWSGIRPLIVDPVAAAKGITGTASLSRTHVLETSPSGMLSILGGKWTTYRRMAQDTVDALREGSSGGGSGMKMGGVGVFQGRPIAPSVTRRAQLLGSDRGGGFIGGDYSKLVPMLTALGLPQDVGLHLAENYGTRALMVGEWVRDGRRGGTSGSGSGGGGGEKYRERLVPHHPFIAAEVAHAVTCEYALSVTDVLARRTRLAFLDTQAAASAIPRVGEIMGELLGWSKEKRAKEEEDAQRFLDTMHI